MSIPPPELRLTPQVFAILSGLIEERAGLSYSLVDMPLFESKVAGRAFELGFDSLLDYYYLLRYDDPDGTEFVQLLECLVVRETYFFREFGSLQVALSKFVVPLIKAGKRPRIWCAACSTGEEPGTIAIWLAERGLLESVELYATDISQAALLIARAGRYGPRSLREQPTGIVPGHYFETVDGRLALQPRITAAIAWKRLNLVDRAAVEAMGEMDLVVCRNVLIYFRDEMVRRVVGHLADRLSPAGVLLVGVSESLMRFGTGLECQEHDGVFLYRKSGAA